MNPLIRRKRAISLSVVAFTFACFGLSFSMEAITPALDGGYDTTTKISPTRIVLCAYTKWRTNMILTERNGSGQPN